MMNKKAQTSHTVIKALTWFMFLIIVLLSIVFLVKGFIGFVLDTKPIEAELFQEELLFTNNGLTYQDEITGRYYPGVVDLGRFESDIIEKSMSYGDKNYYMSVNMTLLNQDGTWIKSTIYNEEWFVKWKPLAKTFLPGPGGAKITNKQMYVLVEKQGEIIPATLNLEIVYPNK